MVHGFFTLMANGLLAMREKRALVPDAPDR